MRRRPTELLVVLSLLLWSACGEGGTSTPAPPAAVAVTISPPQASVPVAQTQPFTATVTNTSNTGVTWLVDGAQGGNATVGTISSSGVFTAPVTVPSPATVTITAVSSADPTKSASVTVTITASAPVSVVVVPNNPSVTVGQVQTFTAIVSNTSNTAVTWQVNGISGGNPTIGQISSQGVFLAPATVPSPATVTVTAISNANPAQSGSAAVTITSSAGVTVTISPATATVQLGATQQFTASVANSTDTTVIWEVNGGQGGSATFGTIDANGLFTAPAIVPVPAMVVVTAVAHADPSRSASATVNIVTSTAVSVTIAPASVTVTAGQTQMFTATVRNTSNTSVTWQVNGVPGGNAVLGTISSEGLYAAPLTPPSPPAVMVTAVSNADTSVSASAQVTIAPSGGVAVTVSPGTATVQTRQTQQFQASVSNSSNQTVTWQVDGVTGGNATVGTIDSNGLFTAPTAAPAPAVVTVTAVAQANASQSASAAIGIVAPGAGFLTKLQGNFVFAVEGSVFSTIGSFAADGKGSITQGQEDNGTGQIALTGSYTVAGDGSGAAALLRSDGTTQVLQFVLGGSGSGPCVRAGGVSFGSLRPQATIPSSPDLTGTWVLQADSSNFTQLGPITGQVVFNSDGTVSGTVMAFPATSTGSAPPVSLSVNGEFQVGSNGRGTITLTSDTNGDSAYAFDLVTTNAMVLAGTPGTGSALRQASGFTVAPASLSGTYVMTLRNSDLQPQAGQGITTAIAGQIAADGKGDITSGVFDSNINGSVTTAAPVTPAPYTVTPGGQIGVTLAAPGIGALNLTVFLASPAAGFAMGTGVFGAVQVRQVSQTPSNALLHDTVGVQLFGFDLMARNPEAFFGSLQADGAGKLTGSLSSFGQSSSAQGSYSIAASGRGTAQISTGPTTRHLALYAVSDTQVVLIGLDAAEELLGEGDF